MAMRDSPPARDPLAGVELRQAARFAMTLVTEQAKVCQKLYRLVELGFPELRELFEDPTCRTARAVLRLAPTATAATVGEHPPSPTLMEAPDIVVLARPRPNASWPPPQTQSPCRSSTPR